jgi:hypothetical protein
LAGKKPGTPFETAAFTNKKEELLANELWAGTAGKAGDKQEGGEYERGDGKPKKG